MSWSMSNHHIFCKAAIFAISVAFWDFCKLGLGNYWAYANCANRALSAHLQGYGLNAKAKRFDAQNERDSRKNTKAMRKKCSYTLWSCIKSTK